MSLRYRLAIVLATLAAVAAGATTVVAYSAARDRLMGEIDSSLIDRARGTEAWVSRFPVEQKRSPMASNDSPLHYDSEIQILAKDGSVSSQVGEVALPVSARDKAIAREGGPPNVRSETLGTTTFRIRTTALPGGGASQVARDVAETSRVLASLRTRFALIGLAVVGAAIVLGWLIARRVTRPIERLAYTAEHVTETGDLDASVTTSRRDETGRLARSFTEMLGALSRSRELQQQLAQDAGHELRTPLTSVRTNVEVLERHADLSPDKRAAIFADLRSELGEVSTLVDELVRLAGDEQDDAAPVPTSLDALVARTAARATRRHDRPITVIGTAGRIEARPESIERALRNLIDNAVKFSPAGAPVEVILTESRVAVRDHGSGIDARDLPKIFDRFSRADAARSLPGSGLGLAIVRQIVDAHGGTVFAENHPDGGALVGFVLPSFTEDQTRLARSTQALTPRVLPTRETHPARRRASRTWGSHS